MMDKEEINRLKTEYEFLSTLIEQHKNNSVQKGQSVNHPRQWATSTGQYKNPHGSCYQWTANKPLEQQNNKHVTYSHPMDLQSKLSESKLLQHNQKVLSKQQGDSHASGRNAVHANSGQNYFVSSQSAAVRVPSSQNGVYMKSFSSSCLSRSNASNNLKPAISAICSQGQLSKVVHSQTPNATYRLSKAGVHIVPSFSAGSSTAKVGKEEVKQIKHDIVHVMGRTVVPIAAKKSLDSISCATILPSDPALADSLKHTTGLRVSTISSSLLSSPNKGAMCNSMDEVQTPFKLCAVNKYKLIRPCGESSSNHGGNGSPPNAMNTFKQISSLSKKTPKATLLFSSTNPVSGASPSLNGKIQNLIHKSKYKLVKTKEGGLTMPSPMCELSDEKKIPKKQLYAPARLWKNSSGTKLVKGLPHSSTPVAFVSRYKLVKKALQQSHSVHQRTKKKKVPTATLR